MDSPIHQQFTGAELRAIVEVAGLADRVVAAHCHGKPGIMAAIEAGVATIEHGTYLDEEACDAMVETGTILVPTRTIIEDILSNLGDVPPYAAAKLIALAATHADAVRLAVERGVTVAMGTDISLTGTDLPNSWGRNGSELAHLVALGMTPLQAIAAAHGRRPAHARARRRRAAASWPSDSTPTSSPRRRSARRHLRPRAARPRHWRLDRPGDRSRADRRARWPRPCITRCRRPVLKR